MMRWSRLAGLCTLLFSCLAVVACDDSEDRIDGSGGTSNDEAGKSAGGKSGSATAGTDQGGSEAGSPTTAGTGFGESGNGGGGSGGTAGAGGMAGSGGAPTCATNCNDSNPCTDDACEQDVCVHRDNTDDCDDQNACTSDDICSQGACKGTNNTVACDDENPCTSSDACANGACYGVNNTDACNDGNVCTSNDACLEGACTGTSLSTGTCNDLSACTTGDQCWNGQCLGTRDLNECPICNVVGNMIQNCDFTNGSEHWLPGFFDGGSGTHDVLNERLVVSIIEGTTNNYAVQPRQEPLSLKQGARYKLRLVAAASVNRSFVISLTLAVANYDIFTPGDTGAGYTVNVTTEMQSFEFDFTVTHPDSDNVKLEIKLGGPGTSGTTMYIDDVYLTEVKCTGNPDCNDSNECTDDVCNVTSGICTSTNRTGACTADNLVCTSDVCVNGACTHDPLDADEPCTSDGDDCTDDVCQGGVCVNEFNNMLCDCEIDAHCVDTNPCTDAHCNNGTCEFPNNTATCDDADVCTSNDVCAAGTCEGTDASVACDTDVCTIQTACTGGAGACSPATNVCFNCVGNGNLLTNCDMAGGTTGWLEGFFGDPPGTGSHAIVDGMLAVTITYAGTEIWQVQPRQEGLVLVQGTTYVVRFNAYATINRPMLISLTQNGDPFASYSGQRLFNLTTEMQDLSFEFTMNAPPPAQNVKLEILLGDDTQNPTVPNTVYLDNLFIAPKP